MKVTTSVYLILEPHRQWQGKVESITVENMTRKPPNLKSSQVALKVNISVDSVLFEQFIPEASIEIRDGRALVVPEVDIEEPPQPEEGEALPEIGPGES